MTRISFGLAGPADGRNVSVAVTSGGNTTTWNTSGAGWGDGNLPSEMTAAAGRVTTYDPLDGNIVSIAVTAQPNFGRCVVNQDNTIALVRTGTSDVAPDSFSYTATYGDASTVDVDVAVTVTPLLQAQGFGIGDHYVLEEDGSGDLVFEYGDNHRDVYISEAVDAYDAQAIVDELADGTTVGQITSYWLRDHPTWGGTAAKKIVFALADGLIERIMEQGPCSHHIYFERGYSYDSFPAVYAMEGESGLHPIVYRAFGTGTRPRTDAVNGLMDFNGPAMKNIVVHEIDSEDFEIKAGRNIMISSGEFGSGEFESNVQSVAGSPNRITIRNVVIRDIWRSEPNGGTGVDWSPLGDRIQGLYISSGCTSVMLDGLFMDTCGYDPSYNPLSNAGTDPHPVSLYSHNGYSQHASFDLTMQNSFSSRAASNGFQFRASGYAEGNFFLDNNIHMNAKGGENDDADWKANYMQFVGNVLTSTGQRTALIDQGEIKSFIDNYSKTSTLKDNIVAHAADPNNPTEFAAKVAGVAYYRNIGGEAVNDTLVYNMYGGASGDSYTDDVVNGPGVNGKTSTELNAITAQKKADDWRSTTGSTIDDFVDYVVAQHAAGTKGIQQMAQEAVSFFRTGFGIAKSASPSGDVYFRPQDFSDGVRWGNYLNWSSDAVPGSGDTVYMQGARVVYDGSARTSTVAALDFGPGGILEARSGKLTVTGAVTLDSTASLTVDEGQFWCSSYTDADMLTVSVLAGRFANSGTFSGGVDLTISDGQALLCYGTSTFTLASGSTLTIETSEPRVGFDGAAATTQGVTFAVGSTVEFVFDAASVSGIGEFRSGALGETATSTNSTITISGGTLSVDVTALTATGTFVLMSADTLTGDFDTVAVPGLGGSRDATVNVNETTDEVTLTIAAGTGVVSHTHTP